MRETTMKVDKLISKAQEHCNQGKSKYDAASLAVLDNKHNIDPDVDKTRLIEFIENALTLIDIDYIYTSTARVRQNDEPGHEALRECMLEFISDPSNRTYKEDLKKFDNGNWTVEYMFGTNGIAYYCGPTPHTASDSPAWFWEEWSDIFRVSPNWLKELINLKRSS